MLEITVYIKAPELAEALRALAGSAKDANIPTADVTGSRLAATKITPEMLVPVVPQTPTPATPVPTAPVAAQAPTAEPDYTHEQLGRAAAAYLDKDAANMARLQELLGQFGVQAVTQLATPAMRTAFGNALRALGAQV